MKIRPLALFFFYGLAALGAARAAPIESLGQIRATAENAVRAQAGNAASQLSLQDGPLDPRLRVAPCDRPLQGFITGDGQLRYRTTVGVRCDGSIRWTLYTSITVESLTNVLVARRPLSIDADLTAADFQLQPRRVSGLAGAYISNPTALAGQRLRHPLAAGEPLTFEALAAANLVHSGQQVILLAQASGIEVRMKGVALADGHEGSRIRVENLSSQRVVEGVVRSDAVVQIPL